MAIEQANKTVSQSAADQLNAMQAMKDAASGQKPITDLQSLMDFIVSAGGNWLSKATGVKIDSLFSTGLDAGMKRDAITNKSVNESAGNFTMRGIPGADKFTAAIFNKENMLAGIGGLPIEAAQQVNDIRSMMGEGMAVAAMSYGELGTLSPPSFGNAMRSEGMSMTT